ncbi:hypothetical protein OE699_08725 [Sedimentimonas flavescens]|uniref:Uncharacterized protein n=1 Tax=Sedimentimonas flavescens TaxID=2851012 RepID=A0ABT2ZYV5_9RHOB|nr:hypothetical protein [Sedimentimonas flavescens]MCV2878939.1 hypothetical protein [Sedimentimonas flavescens]
MTKNLNMLIRAVLPRSIAAKIPVTVAQPRSEARPHDEMPRWDAPAHWRR